MFVFTGECVRGVAKLGDRVAYSDMSNDAVALVVTALPRPTAYGMTGYNVTDEAGVTTSSDLRQHGWKFVTEVA